MSEEIAKWYEDKAEEMGVSQSALMTIALAQYKDTQEALQFANQLPAMLEKFNMLKPIEKVEE